MSQFIEIQSALPIESQSILKGILSKVVEPLLSHKDMSKSNGFDKHLAFSNSQAMLKKKIDQRFVEEVKLADQLQHIIMGKEYESMKKKLDKYARSKSLKIGLIINTKEQTSYFEQEQEKMGHFRRLSKETNTNFFNSRLNIDMLSVIKREKKLAKRRYSIGNIYSAKDTNDRVVFVDRKYNREFAIKKSSLIEAEEIMLGKQNYKQFLSKFRRKQPLVEEAHVNRRKFPSEYVKVPLEKKGIIEKTKNQLKNKLYRAKRVSESSHEVLMRDNSGLSLMHSGQFFNKKAPSAQGQKLMDAVHQQDDKRDDNQTSNQNHRQNKENVQNKGGLTRKKFSLTNKQALHFFQLRKKYQSHTKHTNK